MNELNKPIHDLIVQVIINTRTADLPEAEAEAIRDILWKAWYKAYDAEKAPRFEKAVDTTPAL
jgi:IS4 transposase